MKVQQKSSTTYVEVADELVRDYAAEQEPTTDEVLMKKRTSEAKNVRRRVYDALNVLKAMDIISNENKQIRWKGLPSTTSHDVARLQQERDKLKGAIKKKKDDLESSIVKHVALAQLVKRNERVVAAAAAAAASDSAAAAASDSAAVSSSSSSDGTAAAVAAAGAAGTGAGAAAAAAAGGAGEIDVSETVMIPFIVLSAPADAEVRIEASHDEQDEMREMNFIYKTPFDIHDDPEILKELKLQFATKEFLQQTLPRELYELFPTKFIVP